MSGEKIPTAFGMVTPAPTPDDWAEQIYRGMLDSFRSAQEAQLLRYYTGTGQDPENLPTTLVQRPLDPEYLAARKKFKRRWKRLIKRGMDLGYLKHEHCYECHGVLKVTTDTTEWVEVPNPDYDPDRPNPYATPPATGDPE